MKTGTHSHWFLLGFFIASIGFCLGRRRRPFHVPGLANLQALHAKAVPGVSNEIKALAAQLSQFTTAFTQQLQEMGNRIKIIEQEIKEMKEHTNKNLETMGDSIKNFTTEVVPRTISIIDNSNITLKMSHTFLELGMLVILLLSYFFSRYLRMRPRNDIISFCEYIILGLIQLALLYYTLQILANVIHKHVTGNDISKEELPQLAYDINGLIVSVIVVVIVAKVIAKILVTCLLPCIVWTLKTLPIFLVFPFGWLFQRNLSIRLRLALSALCIIFTSVFSHWKSAKSLECFIVSHILLFSVGTIVNVVMYFTASTTSKNDGRNSVRMHRRIHNDSKDKTEKNLGKEKEKIS